MAATIQPPAAPLLVTAAIDGVALSHAIDVRLRGDMVPQDADARPFARRASSSMVDFLPGGGGFRLSAGLRFDPKRGKGSLAKLVNGAGAGLAAPRGGSQRKAMGDGGVSPAMTMGYSLIGCGNTMLGIEAGAMMGHDRGPMELDRSDPMRTARAAKQRFSGHGETDVGEVVRLSFAQRF